MITNRRPLLAVFLVCSLCMCTSENAEDSVTESIDPDGIRVVENGAEPVILQLPLPTLELEDIVTIGGANEYEDYLIPSADPRRTRIAVGPHGQIGVVDVLTPQVCVYDSSGNFLWKAGRRGEGPGEFRGAQQMQYLDDVGWLVISFDKYHLFDQEGVFLDTKSIRELPFYFGASRFHFMPSGALWYRSASPAFSGVGEWRLLSGNWLTLEASEIVKGVIQERTDTGGNHYLTTYPFHHAYSTDGTVWFNSKLEYEIEVMGIGGGDHWRIRRNHSLRKYSRKERQHTETENVGQIGLDPLFRRLTEREPAIQGMNWIGGEELWVFTTVEVDSPLIQVDVFNPKGVFMRAFSADASLRYAQISRDTMWRLDETSDGFPKLVRSKFNINGGK